MEPSEPVAATDADIRETVRSLVITVDRVAKAVDLLVPAMNRMSASSEKVVRRNFTLRAMLVGMLVLFLGGAGIIWRVQTQSTCLSNWANGTTERSKTLTELSGLRNSALSANVEAEHQVLDYALRHPNGTPTQVATEIHYLQAWNNATAAFLKADDNYTRATLTNPVPQSPKLSCPII